MVSSQSPEEIFNCKCGEILRNCYPTLVLRQIWRIGRGTPAKLVNLQLRFLLKHKRWNKALPPQIQHYTKSEISRCLQGKCRLIHRCSSNNVDYRIWLRSFKKLQFTRKISFIAQCSYESHNVPKNEPQSLPNYKKLCEFGIVMQTPVSVIANTCCPRSWSILYLHTTT